ncbi:MAG: 23S rRNA (pseudouridine(1915)-N(3))-methyltransferase RlmH [Polyangiaceae bacterium]|nr:23S rRNA (pseudouridine(1915)-N(3))-methyltransferase RlmH [Polyangiaceae bacterium]
MKLTIVAVGKLRSRALREVADDYLGRLARYCRVEEIEVKSERELLAVLPRDTRVVALEVDGKELSSTELATSLERWGRHGKGDVAFVLGGAEGLGSAITERADERLSLSRLTLPHRLARIVLLEQLYRGHTLLRGEPYARED